MKKKVTKKVSKKNFKFNGYDWCELLECWGIKPKEKDIPNFDKMEDEDNLYKDIITKFLQSKIHMVNDHSLDYILDPKIKKDIVTFMELLIKHPGTVTGEIPIYKEMLKMEKDSDFVPFFLALYPFMWN